jgi:hypothetical protein
MFPLLDVSSERQWQSPGGSALSPTRPIFTSLVYLSGLEARESDNDRVPVFVDPRSVTISRRLGGDLRD